MLPVFVYPPTIDWDYLHQRPQQILKALARRGCVSLFCNHLSQFSTRKPLAIDSVAPNTYILNAVALPNAVSYARRQWPDREVIVYYSYPPQASHVRLVCPDRVVFDSLDEPVGEFAHWLRDYEQAVRSADFVVASSESLRERAQRFRRDTVTLVPNGCDYGHFSRATGGKVEAGTIGFVGAVASWLEWELIALAADRGPYHFTFVGPLYGFADPPVKRPNIEYLGHVLYEHLPQAMRRFEALWLPFRINEMTRGVNPIKFWEYLATGKPILSTALPEVAETGLATIISRDHLPVKIGDSALARRKRRSFAKANSWDERAERILKAMGYA